MRVVSDDYNSLHFLVCTPRHTSIKKIERILNKLDVVATQVLIEASIVEVTA